MLLKPCPASPNCVCTEEQDSLHQIEPLKITDDFGAAWQGLLDYLARTPGFTIVSSDETYIQAEARTRVLHFVDDLDFAAMPEQQTIGMRSASRLGYSDLGTNRKRLEALRSDLTSQGLLVDTP